MGDFNGDGRLDLVSGSHCCDPSGFHLFLREPDGSFGARRRVEFQRSDLTSSLAIFGRGRTRPHLLDWDRDGKTDLVLGLLANPNLYVARGPLPDKAEISTEVFPIPTLPEKANPKQVQFADWDGDGRFDLLVASTFRETEGGPWTYRIDWFPNTSAKGDPTFGKPSRLLTIPSEWDLTSFAVVDRGPKQSPDLVASVVKDWERKAEGGWTADSQLWLYRQKP